MFLVVDDLDEYFVPGGNGLLKGILGKGYGAEKPQSHHKNGF